MKKIALCLLFLSLALFGCSSEENDPEQTVQTTEVEKVEKRILAEQPQNEERDKKYDELSEKTTTLDEASYKTNDVQLETFERYPNENIDQKVFFLVKVFQIIDDPTDENIYYLGFVTPEKDVQKTVLLNIPKDEVYKKILEDDEIRVLARYKDLYEYKNKDGVQKSAPEFYVDLYQIVE